MDKKKVVSSLKNKAEHNVEKVNPFNKPINKNDTSDTGYESAKLGYRTVKKSKGAAKLTAKTGKKAYKVTKKTVKNTAKAAKKTAKAAKNTAKATYKATKATIKGIGVTIKVATEIVVQGAALLSNPIVLAIVVVLILCLAIIIPMILFMGGGTAATMTNQAYGSAIGLDEGLEDILSEGQVYFDNACGRQKAEFDGLIDSLKYNTGDMPHSDLLFAVATPSGLHVPKCVANPTNKEYAKSIYDRSVSELEAIALVYVYLEKQENESNGTEGEIYKVEFTDDIFDELLDNMVSWNDRVLYNQECPEKNCSVHQEENPERKEMSKIVGWAVDAYNDWGPVSAKLNRWNEIENGYAQDQYWTYTVSPALDAWLSNYNDYYWNYIPGYYVEDYYGNPDGFQDVLGTFYESYYAQEQAIPEYIYTTTCDREHDYHSIQLNVVSADTIMESWSFTDIDKQWYNATYTGLQYYLSSKNEAEETEE